MFFAYLFLIASGIAFKFQVCQNRFNRFVPAGDIPSTLVRKGGSFTISFRLDLRT